MIATKSTPVETPAKAYPYDREGEQMYRDFFGRGENKYGVYPPVWPTKYGKPPLLGIIYADNEFLAAKLAYDRGMSPSQCLAPRIKLLGSPKKVAESGAN